MGILLANAQTSQSAAPLQWQARWIAAEPDSGKRQPASEPQSLPVFRHSFTVNGKIASATLYISGLGQFEAHINGRSVTEAVLTPAWSDYRKRIYYDTYDVTSLLRPGENAIGVMLGNGMYNVVKTPGRYTKFQGSFEQPSSSRNCICVFPTAANKPSSATAPGKLLPARSLSAPLMAARITTRGLNSQAGMRPDSMTATGLPQPWSMGRAESSCLKPFLPSKLSTAMSRSR
ncbi:MAG TPA: alpha-L-rhamnosidase N-terminal domain-containing protein [Alloacidobacterium sp.]|nr:alpha-L-rhamnosidase N-terminal domain-containing protein [Alloacidobacterium sp.]HYK34669.1 alpha-L-rhamnosidase N-terminal domain-containing protein [Alloacidobacterium sp.]